MQNRLPTPEAMAIQKNIFKTMRPDGTLMAPLCRIVKNWGGHNSVLRPFAILSFSLLAVLLTGCEKEEEDSPFNENITNITRSDSVNIMEPSGAFSLTVDTAWEGERYIYY